MNDEWMMNAPWLNDEWTMNERWTNDEWIMERMKNDWWMAREWGMRNER